VTFKSFADIAGKFAVTTSECQGNCHRGRTIDEAYYKKDGIFSDFINKKVTSNSNEETL
jgi:hypothetical protein